MAVVSDIEIRLRADIARLQQDMTQARQAVGGAMSQIRNAVGTAANAIAGLAAAAGVAVFATFIKSAIDAVDAVGDISPATGVAIKDIAGLQLAFQFGGLEAGEFEKTMIKLSTTIAEGDKSLKALGVSARNGAGDLRASKDVLYDLADAFAEMEDGTRKTALATEVFGKSGAALIPMLNGGSEGLREMAEMAEKLGLVFTEEGVEAAGQFNDTLDFLGLALQGVGRQVAVELLPTLNSVAGSFLDLIIKGEGVRKVADVIGAGFKIIYTGAVAVGQAFDTVSSLIAINVGIVLDGFGMIAKTLKLFIMGEYAAAWDAATSGAQKTVASAKNLANDMFQSWDASAKAISGVWTESSGETVAAMAAMAGAQKKAIQTAKEREAAEKAAADAAKKRLAEEARQRKEAEDERKRYMSEVERMNADYSKGLEATSAIYAEVIKGAQKEAETNEELARTFGMTAQQIEQQTIARLEDQLAQRASLGLTLDKIEHLEQLIALKKRNAAATGNLEELRAQKSLWDSIEKTAHDTLVSIADGGKGAAQRLRETFKNVFFDWLYQQTLKKWTIQLQPSATGGGGLLDAAGSAFNSNGGGFTGLMQAGKTLYDGFAKSLSSSFGGLVSKAGELFGSKAASTMGANMSSSATAGPIAGAIIAGMMANNKFFSEGWRMDGQVTDIIKSQMKSSLNGNIFGPIVSVMTASMNVFEKAMAKLGVSSKFASMITGSAVFARAFGRKAPEIESQGLQGTITAGGFTGEAFANILQKGGWFRSDKRSVSTQALDSAQEQAFDDTVRSVVESVRSMGAALGLEATAIDGYSKQIKITLGKDDAENQKLIGEAFGGLADDLATTLLPSVMAFAKGGETASATLQRVAANFQVVDAVLSTLSLTSQQVFGAIGVASIEARERLVSLTGGIEALAAQSDFFAQNFLTAEQRLAPAQKLVTERLGALGYASVDTAAEFRDAVLALASSGRLATEEGAKTYAALIALAPAMKLVTDAAAEATQVASDAAQAAAATAQEAAVLLATVLGGAVDSALAGVQRAVAAQRSNVVREFDALMEGISASMDQVNGRIADLRGLLGALSGARGATANPAVSRQMAQQQLAAVLAVARSSGMLPTAADMQTIVDGLKQDTEGQFATLVEFQRDQLRTANQVEQLAGITEGQLSIEERTLEALVGQRAAAQAAHVIELARLDSIVAEAERQVAATNGVEQAVKTIPTALAELAAVIKAVMGNSIAGAAATTQKAYNESLGRDATQMEVDYWRQQAVAGRDIAGAVASSDEAKIQALYQKYLGRGGEAAGVDFYEQALARGETWQQIEQGFMNSAEYASRIYGPQQSGTMSADGAAMVAELQTMNQRLATVETAMTTTANSTQQFAQQFNNVSAGGNALLTEPA